MKLFENINDILVSDWNIVQQSFINDKPNLIPLIKKPSKESSNRAKRQYERLIKKVNKSKKIQNELLEHYLKLLYQLSGVDISLTKIYTELKLRLIDYNLSIEKNELRNLKGWADLKVQKYPVSKIYNEYLKLLNKSYTDFEFKFNYIREDYKKKWKEIFKSDVPEELQSQITKHGLAFFLWEEYLFLINKFDLNLRVIMSTAKFQEIFIKQKIIKVDDILEIDKRLANDFKENNQFNKWFVIRFDFFDMKKLKFRGLNNQTIVSEIISLSRILEQNIDIEKITIGQLNNDYRKIAEQIIKSQKDARK